MLAKKRGCTLSDTREWGTSFKKKGGLSPGINAIYSLYILLKEQMSPSLPASTST
jgi:hypothetical protein